MDYGAGELMTKQPCHEVEFDIRYVDGSIKRVKTNPFPMNDKNVKSVTPVILGCSGFYTIKVDEDFLDD